MRASVGPVNLGDIVHHGLPDRPAVIDLREAESPRTWTASALEIAMNSLARGVLARGFGQGDRVAIMAENRAEFLVCYCGLMRAGLVAVPINYRLARDTIAFILADADVRAVLVDGPRLPLVPAGYETFLMDEGGDASLADLMDPGPFESVVPEDGALAKILYTSGSTGRPKGVPLDHAGQLWALRHYLSESDDGSSSRTVIVAPTYHKNGLFFSMVALANGFTIVSLPKFEARSYLRAVAEYRCTLLSGIPTMFALIAREHELLGQLDLSSVTSMTIGSAPLTDALITRVQNLFPNAVLANGYGTTEAGPAVFGPHPDGLPRPTLALGVPLSDIEWRLVGGAGPAEGVLELRTPALMSGYLNLPAVTAARIRDGWYDTGDVMSHDPDGFFFFVGRADDMFVCGGENVYPGEIEKLLERCPGIAQAAVVPVPDEIKGMIPVAFVIAVAGTTVGEDEVKRFALEHGPAFSHPRVVLFRSVLPVAGTHKIDRATLVTEALEAVRGRGRH